MLKKLLIIILLFYLLILFEYNFILHFSLFGIIPNLVFILFSLLIFFEKEENTSLFVFYALIAGMFTDIFSFNYIGPSIISLAIAGLLFKKTQLALKNTSQDYPFSYFLPLFTVFLLAYKLLIDLYLYFFESFSVQNFLGWDLILYLICNAIIASAGYYIYKKFFFKIF